VFQSTRRFMERNEMGSWYGN